MEMESPTSVSLDVGVGIGQQPAAGEQAPAGGERGGGRGDGKLLYILIERVVLLFYLRFLCGHRGGGEHEEQENDGDERDLRSIEGSGQAPATMMATS